MSQTDLRAVREHIREIMPKVEQPARGHLVRPFLTPSFGKFYPETVYCWDHFHMSLRFAWGGRPEYLRHLVENLLHHQGPNGFTPSTVSAAHGPSHVRPPFHAQPFLTQAAFLYARLTGDAAWARGVLPKLLLTLRYYETNWRAPFGLFRWPLAYMSGFDNDAVTTFHQPDTIISADVNAWLRLEYLAGTKLAALAKDRAAERSLRARARELAAAVNDVLWDDEAGSYAAYDLCAGRRRFSLGDAFVADVGKFAFQSCSNLIPLYARIAPPARAKRMIETYALSADHFLSPWGIRSLSRSSEYYNNAVWGNPPRYGPHDRMTNSNWQGPVWVPLNYFMCHALRRYGFPRAARDVADRTARVLAKSLREVGSFAENFDGETGAPLYCRNFASWNLLADTMHEDLRKDSWLLDVLFD
jgi:neutral trehalase